MCSQKTMFHWNKVPCWNERIQNTEKTLSAEGFHPKHIKGHLWCGNRALNWSIHSFEEMAYSILPKIRYFTVLYLKPWSLHTRICSIQNKGHLGQALSTLLTNTLKCSKIMLVKLEHFPKYMDEHKTIFWIFLKPPPRHVYRPWL